ncbi:MAG: alpha/beta hydrolase [Bdellovibrionaceae bacterium]|nr:alpha/beta hydrolase [Pseudobdellovibrionaceae bacterium]
MGFLTVGTENSTPINLYYEDHGSGTPVVLIHGWPLSGRSWEKQVPALLEAGFRVITYDRRGFGKSSQPSQGYDASTLAADLDSVMTQLDLREAILVGFSMGGAEVARYLGRYGTERVDRAVFVSAVTPFLLKTEENPEGVEASVFDGIRQKIIEDRPQFLTSFLKDFYNVGLFDKVSDEAVRMSWLIAVGASPIGSLKAVDAWLEDFRGDLRSIDIPVLVVHGDSDKTVPIKASGARMREFIPHCEDHTISGAPHGLNWTHAEELNRILLDFVGRAAQPRPSFSQVSAESAPGMH